MTKRYGHVEMSVQSVLSIGLSMCMRSPNYETWLTSCFSCFVVRLKWNTVMLYQFSLEQVLQEQ